MDSVQEHSNYINQLNRKLLQFIYITTAPLWSNGEISWPQIQRSRVGFLRSSGSGTGSAKPRKDN
jgi:hypothetical protein